MVDLPVSDVLAFQNFVNYTELLVQLLSGSSLGDKELVMSLPLK